MRNFEICLEVGCPVWWVPKTFSYKGENFDAYGVGFLLFALGIRIFKPDTSPKEAFVEE